PQSRFRGWQQADRAGVVPGLSRIERPAPRPGHASAGRRGLGSARARRGRLEARPGANHGPPASPRGSAARAAAREEKAVTPLAIVHTESSLDWGGQQIRILSESQGLIRRGHDVKLICSPEARIFAEAKNWDVPAIALAIAAQGPPGGEGRFAW